MKSLTRSGSCGARLCLRAAAIGVAGLVAGCAAEKPAPAPGPWLVTVAATNTAWSGPWGVSYTANLTPDAETGLGKWTLRDFMATLRTGRHMGRGRLILPPMPIPMYKHFTDSDMDAIFTYLRSIPPVQNRVPEPLPPVATTASTQ